MKSKTEPTEKSNLHPRNPHRFRYDFDKLIEVLPELEQYVVTDANRSEKTIDFSHSEAVKTLNKALLVAEYAIDNWDIPSQYLCPPIPGRADYIHYLADLLAESNMGTIPIGEQIVGLDIGIGANCIYPILGNSSYDWSFVGVDIDENAIQNCKKIIAQNPKLSEVISLQLQTEPRYIFKNIILPEDRFSFTICNPPFHSSSTSAAKANSRKVSQLKSSEKQLNFGGQNSELWYNGGEIGFITQMIYESVKYPFQCFWFTTLVSKKDNLKTIYRTLNKVSAVAIKTFEMSQGQKRSRFVAWTFLSEKQQNEWSFSNE
jgi:23S rRNA (adenine1618-N6)-methyltransferase